MLDKSLDLGLSQTVSEALDSGISISRRYLDSIHSDFETDMQALSEKLDEKSADYLEQIARITTESDKVDGFILSGRGEDAASDVNRGLIPSELFTFSADSVFRTTVGKKDIRRRETINPEMSNYRFFETEDKSVQFALRSSSDSILFYRITDPQVLEDAQALLSGRQTFAQLRLSQVKLSRSFFYPFVITYGVILLISLALAFMLAERLAGPLRRLERATATVASGNWNIQLKKKSGGEIGRLIEGFNSMVRRLNNQRRRIIDMEKMAAWRDMARHLAHEIKNPILPIRLTVQEMKDQYKGNDSEYREFLESSTQVVEDELQSLNRLVKEFSSFAKMPGLSLEKGSIEELLSGVAKLYRKVKTSITTEEGIPDFMFDKDQMRRVLVNLFDNSIAMTEPQGETRVNINVSIRGEIVEIIFSDNGPGIPEENLERIFTPYFTTRREGSGLGLSMVKNVVLSHGGDIEARSIPGEGAVFVINLPMAGDRDKPEKEKPELGTKE